MNEERLVKLRECYTSVVHDVMRDMGRRNFTLPPRITPLQPEKVLCGPAWTVEGHVDESTDADENIGTGDDIKTETNNKKLKIDDFDETE